MAGHAAHQRRKGKRPRSRLWHAPDGLRRRRRTTEKDSILIEPYSNEWHLHHSEEWFLSYVQKYCDEVEDMQPGDFLLYQFGRCISHGAVYVGKGRVIHAYIDRGVVMTDLSDVMFYDAKGRSRLRGIYRFNPKKVRQ